MAFEAVSAGGGEMFPQHPQSGSEWHSLKGKMMAPYELDYLVSDAMNNPRPQSDSAMPATEWDESTIVNTGLTGGGGTMAT